MFIIIIIDNVFLDNNIHSAYIAGRKLFTIQGSKPQLLDWGDYGLRMHFPQDTLLHEEHCEVAVLALAGGNFHFPKGTQLVSAVYSISFEKKINQPVQLEIEHCVSLTTEWQTTHLQFVATGKDRSLEKNVFDFIEGGQFQIGENYGYIEKMHFCETGVVLSENSSSSENNGKIIINWNKCFIVTETCMVMQIN